MEGRHFLKPQKEAKELGDQPMAPQSAYRDAEGVRGRHQQECRMLYSTVKGPHALLRRGREMSMMSR
jgi:hypothetical protein